MDIKAMRQELIKDVKAKENVPMWTITDAMESPVVAWQILGVILKNEEKFLTEIVGEEKKTLRTNFSTLKEMRKAHTCFFKCERSDYNEEYAELFKQGRELLDFYACKVLYDMYQDDNEVIDKAAALEAERKAAASARMKAARAKRAAK